MKKNMRSFISFMLVMIMLLSISVIDIAAATKNDVKSQDLISGPVKSAYVPSVNIIR